MTRPCDHPAIPTPAFDEKLAFELSAAEVRRRWPRGDEHCPDCGAQVITYASKAHYLAGDW